MKLSAKAEYACLAMIELAKRAPKESPARIHEIAEFHKIPERYLVQILLQLKGAGLVSSVRGSMGGYLLAKPAEGIALADILTAIDGPEAILRDREGPSARALATVWARLREAEQAVLTGTSIANLAFEDATRDWTI
ncbi:MAG: Rrf2 family transcriptional regulator [Planctomycetota bacterium]|nr:Rrf2 family transcriptional regulator [Planctomycetota bacterium]